MELAYIAVMQAHEAALAAAYDPLAAFIAAVEAYHQEISRYVSVALLYPSGEHHPLEDFRL